MSAAAQCYKATLNVTTGLSAPFNNLAIIYKQQVQSFSFRINCLCRSIVSGIWSCLLLLASFFIMTMGREIRLICIAELQGNYADAISCYNEVLRIDPLAVDGLVNRGNTYKEIGRVNEAIQDYLRAITIRPTMAEAHANLASAYKDRYIHQ